MHAIIPILGLLVLVPSLISGLIEIRRDYLKRKNRYDGSK